MTDRFIPNFADHYWLFGPDQEIYSSKEARVVASDDAGYVAFLAAGKRPTKGVLNAQELWDVLAVRAPEGLPPPMALQARVSAAAQERLDAWAQAKEYDNIVSLCSYAVDDPDPEFAADGALGRTKRSATWAFGKQLRAGLQNSGAPLPTFEAVMAQLEAAVPLAW